MLRFPSVNGHRNTKIDFMIRVHLHGGGGGGSDAMLQRCECPYPCTVAPNYGDHVPVDMAPPALCLRTGLPSPLSSEKKTKRAGRAPSCTPRSDA